MQLSRFLAIPEFLEETAEDPNAIMQASTYSKNFGEKRKLEYLKQMAYIVRTVDGPSFRDGEDIRPPLIPRPYFFGAIRESAYNEVTPLLEVILGILHRDKRYKEESIDRQPTMLALVARGAGVDFVTTQIETGKKYSILQLCREKQLIDAFNYLNELKAKYPKEPTLKFDSINKALISACLKGDFQAVTKQIVLVQTLILKWV